MNLAVKLWSDAPANPTGIPGVWPYQCREIGTDTSYTLEPGPWQIMSVDAYIAYRANNQATYDAWLATQPVTP